MSQKNQYRVTPRAFEDLVSIGRHTERNWGKKQRNTYLKAIEQRFLWLAGNPLLGKHRSDIHDDYYSFPQGQHVIFYLISAHHIDIIGILHKGMDIFAYFDQD